MSLFPKRIQLLALSAVLATGFAASTAHAGIPALELRWKINGTMIYDGTPAGVSNGNGTYAYNGSIQDQPVIFGGTGATLTYTITADADPFVSAGLTVLNPFSQDIDVELEVILPLGVTFPNGVFMGGSAGVNITGDAQAGDLGAGALVQDIDDVTPVWRAMIDGTTVASLFPADYTLSVPTQASDQETFDLIPGNGPAALNTIGIKVAFNISGTEGNPDIPGDQAGVTSAFFIIPGPGGLAVMALAGLALRRRRRA